MANDRSSVRDRDRDHSRLTATRRGLLATLAVGVPTTLAGCGYQPGAGEFDWDSRTSAGSTGPSWGGPSLSHWLCDGARLVSIRNQSGRTYDVDEGGWVDYENAGLSVYDSSGDAWSSTTERQYAGTPSVAAERVYVPLEDGSVTCLTAGSELDDGTSPEDRPVETRWTTEPLLETAGDEDDPAFHLAAADGSPLLLAAHADGVFGIDADTGDRRFAVDLEVGTLEDDSRIAVGRDRAWVAATGESTAVLYGFDFDGNERVARSLPSTPSWLETATVSDGGDDDLGLVHAGTELWAVGPDGDRRWSLEVGRISTRLVVDGGERLSLASSDTLTAVDPTSGDRLWERDSPFDDGFVVADARGVYGVRTVSSGFDSESRLAAITIEGDDWWDVPTHDDVDGVDDVFLVGDRLVLSDGDRLYAFRTSEGSRRTIL